MSRIRRRKSAGAARPCAAIYAKIHVIYGGIDTASSSPPAAEAMRRELGLQPGQFAFAVVGGYDLPRGKGQREFLMAAGARP